MSISTRLLTLALPVVALTALGGLAASTPASAGCHLIDCVENVVVKKWQVKTFSCQRLWILRNSIYDDAGYCFNTARGKKWFVNDGCLYDDVNDVPLSAVQRKNINTLRSVEIAKGC